MGKREGEAFLYVFLLKEERIRAGSESKNKSKSKSKSIRVLEDYPRERHLEKDTSRKEKREESILRKKGKKGCLPQKGEKERRNI